MAKTTAKTTANDKEQNKLSIDNQAGTVGVGGETHQMADRGTPVLTTQQGVPVADDQNSLRVGHRGPTALEDFHLREKIFHFDHERIPERVVHARGFGAHGYFENYDSLSDVTRADIFQRPGEKTPAFVRFSTVAGNKGSPDLARDVRGFAVKMYTQEGNWDLVGNNAPVFFIQDAIKFPDLIHAVKEAPDRGFPQAQSAHDNFWDFISLTPESMHMVMWIMSDRTIPRSFRFMEGFGVHTFRLVNAAGKSTYREVPLEAETGSAIGGLERSGEDQRGRPGLPPPRPVGRDRGRRLSRVGTRPATLRRRVSPTSSHSTSSTRPSSSPRRMCRSGWWAGWSSIGQSTTSSPRRNRWHSARRTSCPESISPTTRCLQGRNFSYLDTQIKRLGGPNFTHLPINAPKCAVSNFQQDGHMAMRNPKGRANYEPNSWGKDGGPRESPPQGFTTYPSEEAGMKQRVRSETFADHYSQARQFYISQTEIEQQHIANALMFELSKVQTLAIRERMVSHLLNIDGELAEQGGQGLAFKADPRPRPPPGRRDRT